MQSSLPARPSLEQLRKLAKDLVKQHHDGQPEALALIGRHLPELAGKSTGEIASYPFALHDAQSVLARQYGFLNWNALSQHIASLSEAGATAPIPELIVAARLQTVLRARETKDYTLWCSVMSEEMKAFVTKERFTDGTERISAFFKSNYQVTYMGNLLSSGRPIHFWRLWVAGWESDLLIRMSLNPSNLVSGFLFSTPYDSGVNKK